MQIRTRSFIVLAYVVVACSKAPPEPVKSVPDAGTTSSIGDAAAADAGALAATDAGADAGAGVADLGWDLDSADPARDYVKRYVTATKRYGDKTSCVLIGKSEERAGKRAVEVRETPKCGAANALRDVFYVDVAGDRLGVDDPKTRAPLVRWPDDSAPDDKASPVASLASAREWRPAMADAFKALSLAPIRVQLFGRGTYPVVTLAAWRAPLTRESADAAIKDAGKKLCAANDGRAFAVTAGLEPFTWLRFPCDGTYRWENRRR